MVDGRRFDVVLVELDSTRGSEIQKTRPCVVISPDEMNRSLRTVIVAPITTKGRDYPWRPAVTFQGRDGHVALDQIRTVDKQRLSRRVGQLAEDTQASILSVLAEMFAE